MGVLGETLGEVNQVLRQGDRRRIDRFRLVRHGLSIWMLGEKRSSLTISDFGVQGKRFTNRG